MRRRRAKRSAQYRSRAYAELLGRLAANVRRLRESKHWTQEELAFRCDMSTSHYQAVEAARANLTCTTIARLYDALEVDPTELFVAALSLPRRAAGRPISREVPSPAGRSAAYVEQSARTTGSRARKVADPRAAGAKRTEIATPSVSARTGDPRPRHRPSVTANPRSPARPPTRKRG